MLFLTLLAFVHDVLLYYNYRLRQVDFSGSSEFSEVISVDFKPVTEFSLGQNFPNPFNPETRIEFYIPSDSKVTVKVYDMLGNEIMTLLDGFTLKGKHAVEFNGVGLPSGLYICDLTSGSKRQQIKMSLLK